MSDHAKARTGAILFIIWGIIHVIGGVMILIALSTSVESGFAIYRDSAGAFPPIAGSVLGYLAYTLLWTGLLVAAIGATLNWRNSATGLALNTAIVGLTDLGLVIFLVMPGHVSWAEASVGIVLFLAAALFGGLACKSTAH